jgi:hypothetical protein
MEKNKKLSRRYGKEVRGQKNECYQNASNVVFHCQPFATYVEGLAINLSAGAGFPIHHAWVEYRGRIIDPSPLWWKADVIYFPGLRYTGAVELGKAINTLPPNPFEDCELPLYVRFGTDGCNSPEYSEARKLAAECWKKPRP